MDFVGKSIISIFGCPWQQREKEKKSCWMNKTLYLTKLINHVNKSEGCISCNFKTTETFKQKHFSLILLLSVYFLTVIRIIECICTYDVWVIFSLSSSTLYPVLFLPYLASYQQEGMPYMSHPAPGFFLCFFFSLPLLLVQRSRPRSLESPNEFRLWQIIYK